MKKLVLLFLFGISLFGVAQKVEGTELGFDGFFSASNLGGSFGIGPKFGFRFNENLIAGPSARFQRTWSNYFGEKFGYTIYGGGVFVHARYKNVLFGGAEAELLRSPINYVNINSTRKLVPTLFLCAGFSKEFNEAIRLNVGLYYDIINHENSPFRQAYMMKVTDSQGQVVKYVPMIYRISFFFRLGDK